MPPLRPSLETEDITAENGAEQFADFSRDRFFPVGGPIGGRPMYRLSQSQYHYNPHGQRSLGKALPFMLRESRGQRRHTARMIESRRLAMSRARFQNLERHANRDSA